MIYYDSLSPRLPQLRTRFDGRRALFISNRRECAIERKLRDCLGLRVTWVDSTHPRRLHAARKTVQRRGCDLILVATSFVGHDVDATLKPVCKRNNIPYVIVRKGSINACLGALATFAARDHR